MGAEEQEPLAAWPDPMSEPCRLYAEADLELLLWLSMISGHAALIDEVREIAREALEERDGDTENSSEQVRSARKEFRKFSGLMSEMTLSRTVDNYLAYVSDLLALAFRSRPEMLRSSEQVPLEVVLEQDSIEDLVAALAERRVERLSYKGLDALDDYMRDELSFELFVNANERKSAIEAVELRNLIVHKRGIVDRRYLAKVDSPIPLGERVPVYGDAVIDTAVLLRETVVKTDNRAAQKWNIPQSVAVDDLRVPRDNKMTTDGAGTERTEPEADG